MKSRVTVLSVVLAGAAALAACATSDEAPLNSGIDRAGFDESVRPQDDFNRYVNGGWIDATEIPADKSSWGSFQLLREGSDENQRQIIEELANLGDSVGGDDERKIGNLYNSLMDSVHINELGAKPLAPGFERIESIENAQDLVRAFAAFGRLGVTTPMGKFVNVDSGDSKKYAVYLSQSGLGLPNRTYYTKEGPKFDEIRARYPEYIAQLLELSDFDDGDDRAKRIYDLESRLAEVQWTPEDNRDATKTNNRISVADLDGISNDLDWNAYLSEAGFDAVSEVFVRQPSFMTGLGDLIRDVPLDTWKDYLRFHLVSAGANWMADDFANAQFDFYGKLIGGRSEMEPRWQRAVRTVNRAMGDAVGKVYVERHYPPVAKERMDELVANLLKAFEVSIDELDWMSPETKAKAQEKRENFTTKIGYTSKWKDYSKLEVESGDPVGNLARARAWDYDRRAGRLGGEVDRTEWFMTPQTVNAYHNPRLNEIVFPAAILQPPFFDFQADDAVNYGGIGAVIGHEIGHAFDDQGRKTDANGTLNDWWTESDAEAFTEKAQALVEQYNGFEALDGLFVNGQLTLGENIGDLTGLMVSYRAYHMSLNGEEAPVINGMTGDQRFFLGFAQIWRTKYRDEAIRNQVLTNPHSPGMFRANGPLRNFDAFYAAFDVHEGDGMYLAPEQRVRIW